MCNMLCFWDFSEKKTGQSWDDFFHIRVYNILARRQTKEKRENKETKKRTKRKK